MTPVLQNFQVASEEGLENVWNHFLLAISETQILKERLLEPQELNLVEARVDLCNLGENLGDFVGTA